MKQGVGPACSEFAAMLVDSLAGSLDGAGTAVLDRHLTSCAGCRAAQMELAESWATFVSLPPLTPPPEVHEGSRAAVLALLAAEHREAASTLRGDRWWEWLRVPLSVVSALLVVLATMSLLSGVIWGSLLPEGHMFFCAAIFAGLLVGAFSWIFSATTVNGVHLDAAARTGVLALAITVAGTTACPMFNVLAWWKASAIGVWLTDDLAMGPGGSSLALGLVYGLLPGFLAALFGGRMLDDRPLANGVVAAGVVFVLALPVIYLQSVPFTGGVVAAWVAGTAAGALCGVLGALRVRARVVRPA